MTPPTVTSGIGLGAGPDSLARRPLVQASRAGKLRPAATCSQSPGPSALTICRGHRAADSPSPYTKGLPVQFGTWKLKGKPVWGTQCARGQREPEGPVLVLGATAPRRLWEPYLPGLQLPP